MFTTNTILVDTYGNTVKVPEGFKIASDSAINVTGGVVIEDATDGATAGSQFVWIPVGKVYTNKEQTTYETIELKRYVFNEDGTVNEKLSKTEPTDELRINSISDTLYFIEGLKDDITTNVHAKDIVTFISKSKNSHGYYIGRYEARTNTTQPRNSSTDGTGLTQITVEPNDYVYNYVTPLQASMLSKEMYSSENFTSDLVSGYAWDTAILFAQTFDDRISKEKEYSRQTSLNYGRELASKGTNNIENQYQDEICNIWDMASNCWEWTTETHSNLEKPYTYRGGSFNNSYNYTSVRGSNEITISNRNVAFRPILYL